MPKFPYSKQVLVFSNDKRFELSIKGAFEKNSYQIEKDVPILSSLDSIKRVAKSTKSTAFVRKSLIEHIQKSGIPQYICIDYSIDLEIEGDHANDFQKLLKSILLTYLLMSMSTDFNDIHINFFLIFDVKNKQLYDLYKQFPVQVLDLLITRNEKLNAYIAKVKNNLAIFNRIFSVEALEKTLSSHDLADIISKRIKATNDKKDLLKKVDEKVKPEISKDDKPAIIVFKADNQVYVDGQLKEDEAANYSGLTEDQFKIVGSWTSKTIKEVNNRLLSLIKNGIDKKQFSAGDKIVINVLDDAQIDGSLAISVSQMIVNELSKYEVELLVSSNIENVLRKSNGYNLMSKHVKPV